MKVPKRRRRQAKTDYRKRLNLLKSDSPRINFRKSNRYIISQYVLSKEAQDRILFGITSKKLIDYGWPKENTGSLKSLTASYFTGYLAGKIILKNKYKNPIFDVGMIKTINKTKVYAFIKGLLDSGVKIKCPEKCLPDENRIKGKHLKKDLSQYFEKIKLQIDKI